MIYHIVVGDEAAKPLQEAISTEPSIEGEVIVLKDILHVGPLQKEEGGSFSALRSAWWQEVVPNEKAPIKVDDTGRLLEVSARLYKHPDDQAWFWMAPGPADVCAFHWLIKYLSKHPGRFLLVNIANLPFLNETGKVFYPKNLSEILPKELIKARKLARPVTPAEVEIDGEEWVKLINENAGIRIHEGGKKLASRSENHYDAPLISCCAPQFQKAAKVVNTAMSKHPLPTGDLYLVWRLRQMAAAGLLQLKGDPLKSSRDWDVRLPSDDTEASIPPVL